MSFQLHNRTQKRYTALRSERKKMTEEWTTDDFLGGKIRLKQLKDGYRATSDAVLLAAVPETRPGSRILDVGAGTGAVMLCIAARLADVFVDGAEIQPEMAAAARENIALNAMEDRVRLTVGDIRARLPELSPGSYDWVVTNPPFILEDQPSPLKVRDIAHRESACPLNEWITGCLRYVGPKGYFALINRADRLPEILSLLYGRLGGIRIIPVWTREGSPAKRVIVIGRRGSRSPAVLEPGLVLTRSDGTRSAKAEAVMRRGESLFA